MALRLVFFVLPLAQAFRESQDSLRNVSICSTAKCDGQTNELHGEVPETLRFQDCKVKGIELIRRPPFHHVECVEYCTVHSATAGAQEVKVLWREGEASKPCQVSLQFFDQRFCRSSCCGSKCSGETVTSAKDEQWQLQECQLKGADGGGCVERCNATHREESQVLEVLRNRHPAAPACELVHQGLGLQEMALEFMEQLEGKALTLTQGNYDDLPLMVSGRILSFLQKVLSKVLLPELQKADGAGFVREIDNSTVKHLVIIGDLHGQLWNLLAFLMRIKEELKDKGFKALEGSSLLLCDPQLQYVFLGDYVDRGERGLELLLLLLAYKAQCPSGLILLQGNHESVNMWNKYGFTQELRQKVGGLISTRDVRAVTETLPYVAVLLGKFMMMHGGLTPEMVEKCQNKEGRFAECLDAKTAAATVWPDPHGGKAWKPSARGIGILQFGMSIAGDFLWSNNLQGMFRGHEQVSQGYEVKRKGRGWFAGPQPFVATVFSAADYVGRFCPEASRPGEGNLGAFVLADLDSGKVSAVKLKPSETRRMAAELTGATCGEGLLQQDSLSVGQINTSAFQRRGRIDNSSCSLGQSEADSVQDEVMRILTSQSSPEDREFEVRKLIDLQGEALIHGEEDAVEICKSLKKDQLTMEVYKKLQGTDEELLENEIKIRVDELQH